MGFLYFIGSMLRLVVLSLLCYSIATAQLELPRGLAWRRSCGIDGTASPPAGIGYCSRQHPYVLDVNSGACLENTGRDDSRRVTRHAAPLSGPIALKERRGADTESVLT